MDTGLFVSTTKPLGDPPGPKVESNIASLETKPTCLEDIPIDILEHIISFLSTQSILNLIVNRALRPICEQNLYRKIRILSVGRTYHLCKTFVLRPDLALLVRDLDIAVPQIPRPPQPGRKVPSLPTFSREGKETVFTLSEAISLAKNVRSFCAAGGALAADPHPVPLLDLVCGMQLTRLKINSFSLIINQSPTLNEEYMTYFRTILQAQPLLEHLELPNSKAIAGWIEHPDLQPPSATLLLPESISSPKIKCSDIPNLRSLVANTSVAASFLAIAPKLESLSIADWDGQLAYFLQHAERRGHQIRNLSLSLPWGEFVGWEGIADVLRCFPNVETLVVSTWWLKIHEGATDETKLLGQVSRKIHLLPLLRKFEVYYDPNEHPNFEITQEQLMALKASCPRLECVIDPFDRIWTYSAATDHGHCSVETLGRLMRESKTFHRDIPYPDAESLLV